MTQGHDGPGERWQSLNDGATKRRSGGRRWCQCLRIQDVSSSEPRREDSKKPWSPDPPTLRLHRAKNFWRRKKNVVGSVAYLHQPLHALDMWGLWRKVETWVSTPSSALKRHLLLVLASLPRDSVSPSILQLRNGVNQDIPSLCRSCCKKTGPVPTTNSICKALILSQELCFKWESWRRKDPILPLTSSVLSVMTHSWVISHWAVSCAKDWTLGGGNGWGDPRRLPGGGCTCAILAKDCKCFRKEWSMVWKMPFSQMDSFYCPMISEQTHSRPALRGMPSCSCPCRYFLPNAAPNRI